MGGLWSAEAGFLVDDVLLKTVGYNLDFLNPEQIYIESGQAPCPQRLFPISLSLGYSSTEGEKHLCHPFLRR